MVRELRIPLEMKISGFEVIEKTAESSGSCGRICVPKKWIEKKAQGALEYLLMIGVVILVVVGVVIGISVIITQTNDQNVGRDYDKQMQILEDLKKGNDSPMIFSFRVGENAGWISGNSIIIILPHDTELNIAQLSPQISIRGVSVSPEGPQDFTKPVVYTVVNNFRESREYIVSVQKENAPPSTDKRILSFRFPSLSVDGFINETAKTVTLEVPYGSSLMLAPHIEISGAVVSPQSGVPVDFANPMVYTVIAEDGSKQEYIVGVNIGAEPDITPPVVNLTEPFHNFYADYDKGLSYSFTVSDDSHELERCELLIWKSGLGWVKVDEKIFGESPQESVQDANLLISTIKNYVSLGLSNFSSKVSCWDKSANVGDSSELTIRLLKNINSANLVQSCYSTSYNPHPICNCFDLNRVREHLDWNYYLAVDINMNVPECSVFQNGVGFEPIGTLLDPFSGSLTGNGYIISNLYINRPSTNYAGLFGYLSGNVRRIGLEKIDINSRSYVGGLAGEFGEIGVIEESFVDGNISGSLGIGGLVGRALGVIKNSYSSGKVSSLGNSAGGVASSLNNGKVLNSFSLADVESDRYVGGALGGIGAGSELINSFSTGKVVVRIQYGAGLIGVPPVQPVTPYHITNSHWDIYRSGRSKCWDALSPVYCSPNGSNLGVNADNVQPDYWFHHSNEPMNSWGEWISEGGNKYTTTDNIWGICEGSSYPWLTWENRTC